MFGPPGNGKTLLAKAVACESGMKFFNVSAGTLMNKYVGESEKMLRGIFELASACQPSVIFIDEIDSLMRARRENEEDYSRRLKTEFLCQFDGVNSGKNEKWVFVIGATNRPQDLDSAVLRRFDKRILIDVPSQGDRELLLKSYLADIRHSLSQKDVKEVSSALKDYSGSDISNIIKSAIRAPMKAISTTKSFLTISKLEIPLVTKKDFLDEIKKTKSSCDSKEVEFLRKWAT